MHTFIRKSFLSALPVILLNGAAFAASTIATRLDDPRAVYLTAPEFGAHADGTTDDSAAVQAAIDQARQGVVFVSSGRYRLTRTIFVPPGVRLFGFGPTRPVFVLAPNTPGYQKGVGVMVTFTGMRAGGFGGGGGPGAAPAAGRGGAPAAGGRGGAPAAGQAAGRGDAPAGAPAAAAQAGAFGAGRGAFRVPFPPPDTVPPNPAIADADQNTFYAALSNIDFEIGDGNPAAVAIRFHVAQHCFLSHMDFHIGSGLAALTEIGNEAEDLHFYGGRYGILTDGTSPGWQFTLIDSEFQGQRDAAIREHNAGMTLIRDSFHDTPVAVEIDPHYYDQLWLKDCRFENLSGSAVIVSNEKTPLNEIGFQNAILRNVPVFALFRESGKKVEGKGLIYRVANFNFGLILPGEGRTGTIGTIYEAAPLTAMPAPMAPGLPALPPTSDWVNVHTLGVTGDGATDDTAAIQKAIAEHRVLYFPSGRYMVSDTLALKPDTVLIGLHPTATQFVLPDNTPAFQGVGAPRAVISAPSGGTNILSGFGISTSGINPRAVCVLWRAGEGSLIDDVRMQGPGGANNIGTADTDVRRRWDGQYPSLWITEGGGGTFADIWTPNTYAQAGFYVSDTKTPGHVYELSNEHHVRNEIKFDHVDNWDINAPQTEEEAGDSPEALSLEIDASRNITIANYHAYRVTRSRAPFPAAARVYNSSDIHFRNVHVNSEAGYPICDANGCATFLRVSKYPFESSIEDVTHHLTTREREFAVLDIPASPAAPLAPTASAVLEAGATVKKLEEGFFSISGAAVDASGKLYFVDHHQQRIYGWSAGEGLTVERDSPLDAVNLAFDKAGDILVLSSAGPEGTVYTFHPGSPKDQINLLSPVPAQAHPGARVILPVNYWNDGEFRSHLNPDTLVYETLAEMFQKDVSAPQTRQYVSPDGSAFLPAFRVFQQGPADSITGWRFSDTLDTYGFVSAQAGSHIYVSSEAEDVTYRALVNADGSLGDLQPFAQRGGESVAADARGNVYVANGQIFVYDATGKQIGEIEVAERPLDLVFGGPDGRTLFILAHHALFAVRVRG